MLLSIPRTSIRFVKKPCTLFKMHKVIKRKCVSHYIITNLIADNIKHLDLKNTPTYMKIVFYLNEP